MTKVIKRGASERPKIIPTLEAELIGRGGVSSFSVSGVVCIGELSEEAVLLVCHGGRLRVTGERLDLVVFENRSAEIRGKISGVTLTYGKK